MKCSANAIKLESIVLRVKIVTGLMVDQELDKETRRMILTKKKFVTYVISKKRMLFSFHVGIKHAKSVSKCIHRIGKTL